MKWKFWKKPEPQIPQPIIKAMPMAALFRWYCYDLELPDVRELSDRFGITPISREVEEAELAASEKRRAQIIPLANFFDTISVINTGVMMERNREVFDRVTLSAEQGQDLKRSLQDNFYGLSMAALIAGFAAAIDLKLVEPGLIYASGVGDLDDQF